MRFKFLFFLICSVCFLGGCKSKHLQTDEAYSLDGIWLGEAYQFDVDEIWDIEFRSNVEENMYVIEYPSLGCSGNWMLEQQSGNIWKFREILDKGLGKCTDKGMIVIEIKDPHNLAFYYFWPDDHKQSASGYLKKK